MSAATQSSATGTVYIEVQHLWKVFGDGDPAKALALAADGADRAAILAETGQTVGVRDVSFEVPPARRSSSWACPAAASRR